MRPERVARTAPPLCPGRVTRSARPPPPLPADPADPQTVTDTTRYVGLVVARGTAVTIIGPEEGMHEIPNPFLEEEAVE